MTYSRRLAALLLVAGFAAVAPADELDDWVAKTAALKAEDQLAAVRDKLRELNKDFGSRQGEVAGKVVDGVVRELAFDSAYVADIRPLRPLLRDLEHLHCPPPYDRHGKVADLTPLKGMRLKSLNLERTAVADLSPLDGMPLEAVHLQGTKVKSLKPLHKAPLKFIHLPLYVTGDDPKKPRDGYIAASEALFLSDKKLVRFGADHFDENTGNRDVSKDLAVILKGSKDSLQVVSITFCALTNLKFLEGTPVRQLDLRWCPSIADLKPLQKCDKLESLSLQLVKGPLDLAPLKGKPLSGLSVDECPGVTDLRPLAGTKTLTALSVRKTGVRDLTPVGQCEALETLYLGRVQVASLRPLEKCTRLNRLDLTGTTVDPKDKSGFAPVGKLPLDSVLIEVDEKERPTNAALVKVLRTIQTLKTVNGMPAAEVLK